MRTHATDRIGRRLVVSVFFLLSLTGAILSGGCSAAEAERAVDQQVEVVETIAARAETLRAALGELAANIDALAEKTMTVREALGPAFDELPPEARATVLRIAEAAGGGLESALAVASTIDGYLAEAQANAVAAMDRLERLRADLAEAESDEERFFDVVTGGIGALVTLITGVPVAGAIGARRGRKRGALEVAAAYAEGFASPAGGENIIDVADVDTRERINAVMPEATRAALRRARLEPKPKAGAGLRSESASEGA